MCASMVINQLESMIVVAMQSSCVFGFGNLHAVSSGQVFFHVVGSAPESVARLVSVLGGRGTGCGFGFGFSFGFGSGI